MDEGKFWLRLWLSGATALVVLVSSCTVNSIDRRAKWEKAVANGADPMVAACALFDQQSAEVVLCSVVAQTRK